MTNHERQRRAGSAVVITLIIVSIIVIVGILLWMNCQYWKEGFNKHSTKTKSLDRIKSDSRKQLPLLDETPEVPHADGTYDDTSKRIHDAEINKQRNIKLASPTLVEQEAIPGGIASSSQQNLRKAVPGSGVRPNSVKSNAGMTHIEVDSVFDVFTPKENTMDLYGVTEEQLRQMVKQYREEHKYEVPKAPSTLTFNINKWEAAQERMRDSNGYIPKMNRDSDFGLVYNLQVDSIDD